MEIVNGGPYLSYIVRNLRKYLVSMKLSITIRKVKFQVNGDDLRYDIHHHDHHKNLKHNLFYPTPTYVYIFTIIVISDYKCNTYS